MAVSQVDRLKNPFRVWTWNSLVATQPPPSAPTMPIRHVRITPCDLLPGISILASRPATRPRTIQARRPITDALVSVVREVPGGWWAVRDGYQRVKKQLAGLTARNLAAIGRCFPVSPPYVRNQELAIHF